jgi:hypothetical protein
VLRIACHSMEFLCFNAREGSCGWSRRLCKEISLEYYQSKQIFTVKKLERKFLAKVLQVSTDEVEVEFVRSKSAVKFHFCNVPDVSWVALNVIDSHVLEQPSFRRGY